MILTDPYHRRLSYLRLSVTDLCNYRCNYCLPDGYQGKAKNNELSLLEIDTLVQAFAQSGTRKIRLTGGEPTLRRDLADIIAICRLQQGIEEVALTTNGYRLAKLFPQYQQAGLNKINISLDSFQPDIFQRITGKNECLNILQAIDGLLANGVNNIKINTLLLKENQHNILQDTLHFIRTRPITLRFIELMRTGNNALFFNQQHCAASQLEDQLLQQGWQLKPRSAHAGPAREYRHPDFTGGIGFITPYSRDFCQSCNRLRVSAQGKMHLCLFGGIAYDLRPWLHSKEITGLQAHLNTLIAEKPQHHFLHQQKFGLIHDLSMLGG